MNRHSQPVRVRRKRLCAAIMSGIVVISAPAVIVAASTTNPTATPQPLMLAATCNPCNPCAAKCNPCNPCNPCAATCNPCNPCAGAKVNPCKVMRPAGTRLRISDAPAVIAEGKRLWNDKSISSNGLACQTCHMNNALLNATFAKAYPHRVAMPQQRAGVAKVDVDEMVQFCMVVPMQTEPFAWNSKELMALSSYTLALQGAFNPCAAKNPCTPCNPCAVKNPCSPCSPCNPCATKNPCSPCNPCNPCAVSG